MSPSVNRYDVMEKLRVPPGPPNSFVVRTFYEKVDNGQLSLTSQVEPFWFVVG